MTYAPLKRHEKAATPAPSVVRRRPATTSGVSVERQPLLGISPGHRITGPIQAKLTVGASNDPLEHEADTIAESVVAKMPRPASDSASGAASSCSPTSIGGETLQRKCDACSEEEEPVKVQRRARDSAPVGDSAGSSGIESQLSRLRNSGGRPLEPGLRRSMEHGFGADFSRVKLHADDGAADLAQRLNARAFTAGRDVFFNRGELRPTERAGQKLIAHELAHVLQQGGTGTIRRAHAAPASKRHPWEIPCGAATQKIADAAKTLAGTRIGDTITQLQNIQGLHQQDPNRKLDGLNARVIRNAFGNDLQELEGISGGFRSLADVVQRLGSMRSGLSGITVTCADQSIQAVSEGCHPSGAPTPNAAFVDPNARSFVFLCNVANLTMADVGSVAETIVHEASHAILGTGHAPLLPDDNENAQPNDVPTVFDCTIELGVSTDQAFNNAYAYDALVNCLSGGEPGLKEARDDIADTKKQGAKAAALEQSKDGEGARKLLKRLEAEKLVLPNKRNARRAADLLFLDRYGSEAFDLDFDQRVRANAVLGKNILRSTTQDGSSEVQELDREGALELVGQMGGERRERAARLLEQLERDKLVLRVPRNAQRARDLYVLIQAGAPGFAKGQPLLRKVVDLFSAAGIH